jgi:hypothetical protein
MTFHQGCGWEPSAASGPTGWTRCASNQRVTRCAGGESRTGLSTDAGTLISVLIVLFSTELGPAHPITAARMHDEVAQPQI